MADLTYRVDIDTRQGIANIKKLNTSLKQTEKITKKTDSAFTKMGKGLLSVKTAVVGLVGAAGLGALVKQSLASADALGKVADKVGVTVEELQELRFAAEQSGVASKTLDVSLQRFSRRIGEAAQGTGVLSKVLKETGVSIRNTDGTLRSTNDIFNEYADAIANTADQQEKLRLAFAAFDSEGAALVNLFKNGSEGVNAYRKELHELNGVVGRDQVDAAARMNDAWGKVQTQFRAIATIAAAELAPALEEIANNIQLALKDKEKVAEIANAFRKFGEALVFVVDNFGPLLEAVKNLAIAWATLSIAKHIKLFDAFKTATANYGKAVASAGSASATAAGMFGKLQKAGIALIGRLGAIGAAVWFFTEAVQGNIGWVNQWARTLGVVNTSLQDQLNLVKKLETGDWGDRLRFFGPDAELFSPSTWVEYWNDEELAKARAEIEAQMQKQADELKKAQDEILEASTVNKPTLDASLNGGTDNSELISQNRDLALSYLPLKEAHADYIKSIQKLQAAKALDIKNSALYDEAIAAAANAYKEYADSLDPAIQAQKKLQEERKAENDQLKDIVQSLADEADVYSDIKKLKEQINKASARGLVNERTRLAALQQIAKQEKEIREQQLAESRKWSDGWQRAFNDYVDEATNAAKHAEETFRVATQGMEDAIVNFAKTGKFEFKSFLSDIVDQLLRSQAQQLVANLFGGLGLGGATGKSGFAGFFANGGLIPSGQFGIVGEQGPELVSGPAQVTPLNGAGGTTNVNYYIQAFDTKSWQQRLATEPEFLYAVTEQGRAGIPSRRV